MTIQRCNAVLDTMSAPSTSDTCKASETVKAQQAAAGTATSASFPWGPQGCIKAAEHHLLSCFSLATPSDTAGTKGGSPAIFMHWLEEMTQGAAVQSRAWSSPWRWKRRVMFAHTMLGLTGKAG